jgi:hypothetical protein
MLEITNFRRSLMVKVIALPIVVVYLATSQAFAGPQELNYVPIGEGPDWYRVGIDINHQGSHQLQKAMVDDFLPQGQVETARANWTPLFQASLNPIVNAALAAAREAMPTFSPIIDHDVGR